MPRPRRAQNAVVAVARLQAVAERLGALVHAHDDGMVSDITVEAVLEAMQKFWKQPRHCDTIACIGLITS